MQHVLTAGAQRALEGAAKLAWQAGADEVRGGYLLWALLLDGSRAADLLEGAGVGAEELQRRLPLPPSSETRLVPQSLIDVEQQPAVAAIPLDRFVQQVVRTAGDLAGGRRREVGSEHLLWGLAEVPGPVTELLREYGLTPDRLEEIGGEELVAAPQLLDEPLSLRLRDGDETERLDALRILDAAANRAREGVRVLEDYVRFVLDDAHLSRRLKEWRHGLAEALRSLPAAQLIAARETQLDVGTQIHTLAEARRDSLWDVVQANCKRVEEALRTLEEYSKVVSPLAAERCGQQRYAFYTLEKALAQTGHARQRLAGRDLYLLVTDELCHHGFGPAVRGAIAGGAGIIQLREKQLNDRALVEKGRRVRAWTREGGALFIMNDRPDLAVLTEADGVHVGQEELTVRDARRIVGPDKLVGVSTHTIEQARQAVLDGADYIGVGPVFVSQTKSFDAFAGLEFVRQVAAEITLPWYAIGGIQQTNLAEVIAAGARRIAVSGAICRAEQPDSAARELAAALSQAREPSPPPA